MSVMHPQKLERKNLTFEVFFFMKLTYDDKRKIYDLRNQGYSLE